ncbi:DUF3048 domain-containing protein [Streptomyces termitum]|uniref:DUF3048 domain-containing protein n=1 Tax=Streptomyces termitum TaxID=67368 RepID=UPI00379B7897
MPRARGPRRPGRTLTALLCAVAATALYGCTGTVPPDVSRTPAVPAGVSPLTGLPATPGPVLAVKIDNVAAARPQTGLGAADLVYVEQVEGGVTRLLAVYSSRLPERVGPVRSARESDISLLRPFGRPALAYSGAQTALDPLLRAASLDLVTEASAPAAFRRSPDRPAPHNLYVRPRAALAAAPDATDVRPVGLVFGAAPAGGTARTTETVRFPAARYAFTWSAADRGWRIALDGRPVTSADGARPVPATVVVQRVTVRASAFHDVNGAVSPYTETTGSGTALVLRDGRAHEARWSRPDPAGGTAFTTPDGRPLAFAPGQVWIVLAPNGGN